MQYLVQMKLASASRSTTPQEGMVFIEQFVLPTLEMCKKLQDEKRILAGGPLSGTIALALVVSAESIQELDELVSGLPIWPRMETEVIPLTSFEGRMLSLRPRLEQLKARIQNDTAVSVA